MSIKLQESLRAVFYAPFYVALARGAFAAEGVQIEFVSSPRPQDAAVRLMDGSVDVCWGGPMRVMQTYQAMAGCDIVSFAEVVSRDPFLLLGSRPNPGFALADLAGLRLATVSEVPTPWLCLQHDLRLAGLDPDRLTRVADRSMADNTAALQAGTVDVVQVFEPFVSLLEAQGAGHVWYAAARRGPTSYTTFYARRGMLHERRDELLGMVRAIARTEQWVARADAAEIADAIASYFPDLPAAILELACARYKTLEIWGQSPVLPREGYDRLRASLVSGGFVSQGAPFETAVDNSLAEQVVAERLPPLP
jgi:NitT/TauT family transport system substrate-binding protein